MISKRMREKISVMFTVTPGLFRNLLLKATSQESPE